MKSEKKINQKIYQNKKLEIKRMIIKFNRKKEGESIRKNQLLKLFRIKKITIKRIMTELYIKTKRNKMMSAKLKNKKSRKKIKTKNKITIIRNKLDVKN